MKESDKLIYEKSNAYRLHTDKLRWTLLAGYAAFFAVVTRIFSENGDCDSDIKLYYLVSFAISTLYFLVLAVQNWFYNLFAQFVTECEFRIVNEKNLRSLEEFAKERGEVITPFHSSFFFSLLIVALLSSWFLSEFINAGTLTTLVIFVVYFSGFYFAFKKWNSVVYRNLIEPFSNLFNNQQMPKE